MSLDKVNEGFEGDQKTLVKGKDVSFEEGQGGDGRQVTYTIINDGDDISLEQGQGGDGGGHQVVLSQIPEINSQKCIGRWHTNKGPAKHPWTILSYRL